MTEGPYTLPKGWRWVRLGDVAQIYAGSSAPQGEQYFRGGKWPFVRVQDLGRYGQTTCLKETANYVNEYALQKYRLRLAKAGTILFPKSGAAILTNSRAILGVDAYIVSHLAAVEPLPDKLDTYWAYFWLCTVDMKEFIDNPSYPSLRLSEVSKLLIPLPPLEEQRRIVARIEELLGRVREARRLREEAKNDAERLWQAILAQTFPRPGSELPEGWRWAKLGEVSEIIMGQSPPSKSYNTEGKGLPFFQGKADFGDLYPIPRVWCGDPKKIAHAGDILISVRAPVGPTNMAAEDCCIGRGLAALRPRNGIDPFWVLFYLRSIEGVIAVMGTGSTFNAITKKELEALFIPLPPLEEQRRIVAHLQEVQEKIKALEEAQEQTEAELKRLEQAILEKAFRGEL